VEHHWQRGQSHRHGYPPSDSPHSEARSTTHPNRWIEAKYRRTGEPYSLRWIMLHMIEEYARHNGHADLIRESIDGSVGE
jgi:hypothetical protein